jgi:hypothetical protein
MAAKKGKKVKVQDLKPKKDAKGGVVFNTPGHNTPGHNIPGHNSPGHNSPGHNIGGH